MSDRGAAYDFRRKLQVLALNITSPAFMSKVYFRVYLKQKLHLDNPITFNEKIQWLKLYDWPYNKEVIRCADKYLVRDYVSEHGYSDLLNDLVGVWESVDEIDWTKLPDQFALKCNHGCGYNIICGDKSKLNIENAKKVVHQWMKEDFGKFNAEIHYDKIPKKIICERYLGGNMIDYKFFCFDGNPAFMYIAEGFGNGQNECISFFDENGQRAPYGRSDYPSFQDAELPEQYEKMKMISADLSKGFPFVRVDLFESDGKIYFSELTFTPCGGLMKITPSEYDRICGEMLKLER